MLRWGMIGFGWVARDYMAPGIATAGDAVVAVCDPAPEARAAAAAIGILPFADLDDFLGVPLDAVYVATPNHRHRAAVEACAAAGMPVLCEKPIAASLDDAEAMVAACWRHGTLLGIAFDQRRHPAHRVIASAIQAGRIGRVTAIRIVYGCWLGPEWSTGTGANWRTDAAQAGGGAIIDLAPHGLDLVDALVGEPVVVLSGLQQARVQPYAVDDGGMLVGRTRSGILVSIHNSYNTPDRLPRRRLEVVGTAGEIVALDTMGQTAGGSMTLTDAATGTGRPLPFDGSASPFAEQARAFAAAVRGAAHDFNATRDLAALRLLAGVYAADARALEPA